MKICCLALLSLVPLSFTHSQEPQQRRDDDPLEHLPDNIEILTRFGERADFSPDNKRVAFMAKSFGDAMVIDLETREISCLTCNVPAAVFLRVMHLVTGDYLLIGPEYFQDIATSRFRDNELWFLSKEVGSKPVKLGVKLNEGAAISKQSLKIAFAQGSGQIDEMPDGSSRIVTADIDLSGDTARVINIETVFESPDRNCAVEAQDFFDNDTKLTFSCYEPNSMASVMTLDLQTGETRNHTPEPNSYNEPEGIVPSDQYTLVESDKQTEWLGGRRGPWNIDIWKMSLDPAEDEFERLTRFNDFEGGKASNPVVSTDGKLMAFQVANNTDPAGVGYGILLYRFEE